MPSARYLDPEQNFRGSSAYEQTTLDGFDRLWNATEAELPNPQADPQAEQDLEARYLRDEIAMLREENAFLKLQVAHMARQQETHEQIAEDYSSLMALTKSLIRKCNHLMSKREQDNSRLAAIRSILLG